MSIPFTWCYLIYDPYTELFKIGKADNPDERLKQLCRPSGYGTIPAAPAEYLLCEAWLAPDACESQMHTRFAEVRIRGEWFDLYKFFDVSAEKRYWHEIDMEFGSLMATWPMWSRADEGYHSLYGENSISRGVYIQRLRQTIEMLEKELSRSRLVGYAMPLALPPARG
jgi:hypothetical protein